MPPKRIYKKLFLLLITINILSCGSSDTPPKKVITEKNNLTEFQVLFFNMRSNADKLIFKRYYLNPDSNISANYDNVVWVDSTNDLKKIEAFDRLFKSIKDGGYCCCPPCHYTVSFYKDKSKLGFYCVDTSSLKGMASFFDESYQTSYSIDLNTWNSYLMHK